MDLSNQVKGSNRKGARALYNHLTKGDLFGIGSKIKAETKPRQKHVRSKK